MFEYGNRISQSIKYIFDDQSRRAGAPADLVVTPGADHADPKFDEPPAREATLAFLTAALNGPEPAS
jgi:hypothetical protein